MTATVTRPDVVDVLKRADGQYAKRAGDDPAIPEYLTALATAVRPLLGQPVAAPVDDGQVQQLLDDKQRLGDIAGELRKQAETRAKVIDRQVRGIAELKQKLAAADEDTRRRIDAAVQAVTTATGAVSGNVDELRRALAAKDKEIDEARAERDTARAQLRDQPAADVDASVLEQAQRDNARLADELACARRDLAAANRTLDEIADDEASRPATAVHRHRYPLDETSGKPLPCECKQPHPHDPAAYEVEDVEPDAEPLAALLSRIGSELTEAGWQW